MNDPFFNVKIVIRIRREELKEIKLILVKDPESYENVSHFVRSAIIKKIKEEKK
jgi:hypothetical protein|tara:strand:- start:2282 stop:2443 length:162 start_codon:yes stop_codon:yes gene_type:complete